MSFQIYQYFKHLSNSRLFLRRPREKFEMNSPEVQDWGCSRWRDSSAYIIYDVIGWLIFCSYCYRYGGLQSARVIKNVSHKNKSQKIKLGIRVSLKCLISDFVSFGSCQGRLLSWNLPRLKYISYIFLVRTSTGVAILIRFRFFCLIGSDLCSSNFELFV